MEMIKMRIQIWLQVDGKAKRCMEKIVDEYWNEVLYKDLTIKGIRDILESIYLLLT